MFIIKFNKFNCCHLQDGTEQRLVESLSLIDAVMPDVVATRQNQQNQQKQIVKTEPDANGEESKNLII